MAKINRIEDQPFNAAQLEQLHSRIDTPALLIFESRLQNNINRMQQLALLYNTRLRPHTKTHKSLDLAKRQIKAGAAGITVAKLAEAEVMITGGLSDVFVANQIVHPLKIKRLAKLHKRGRIIVGLDHPDQVRLLESTFKNSSKPLEVRIEIDSGLNRCGIPVGARLIDLAKMVMSRPWLSLEGIFTHAGQAYMAKSRDEIVSAGQQEGQLMQQARDLLKKHNIEIQTVSVGSTPTVPVSVKNEAVNEIRPGNYIFNDGTQLSLGSAKSENCSLFVLATVISQPGRGQMVIDAGSKALHHDPLLAGNNQQTVYGMLPMFDGRLSRLSEEHGVVHIDGSDLPAIGSPVLIIPNHACVVANLYDRYFMVRDNFDIVETPVSARGKSQ